MKNFILSLSIVLTACGTFNYAPEEYVIAPNRIPAFDVRGDILVENIQSDQSERVFFNGPSSSLAGNYKTVSSHLANQLSKEIGKNGVFINKTSKKKIQVKVLHLEAMQQVFHFRSSIKVELTLGDGSVVVIDSQQGSPGDMWRVLNGTIAISVIDILKHKKVLDYLAQ